MRIFRLSTPTCEYSPNIGYSVVLFKNNASRILAYNVALTVTVSTLKYDRLTVVLVLVLV